MSLTINTDRNYVTKTKTSFKLIAIKYCTFFTYEIPVLLLKILSSECSVLKKLFFQYKLGINTLDISFFLSQLIFCYSISL
jgi:hypothetical protein